MQLTLLDVLCQLVSVPIGGCKSFGSHPLVCRFIKGFFESRPSHLFAGHLVGSKPMKRKKNWNRMLITLSSSSKLKNKSKKSK